MRQSPIPSNPHVLFRQALLGLLCLGSLVTCPLLAATTARYAGDPIYTMVDLRFGHMESDIEFDDGDSDREFDNDYIVISLLSEFAPYTQGGLLFWYMDGAPDGRDVAEGLNPSGYGIGFGFDGRYPLLEDRVFFVAGATYQYIDTESSREDQSTTYEWWTLMGRAGAALRLGRFELRGGGVYRTIDGEERTRGDLDRTTDIEIARRDSAFLELDFNTDPQGKGHVGVLIESGGTDQLGFYFRRFF